jgi:hypothetical protein
MIGMSRNFAFWLLLACSLPLPSTAQSNPFLCKSFSSESKAPDVDLRLTLADGKSVYHEGEIIPLKLAFAARVQQNTQRTLAPTTAVEGSAWKFSA